MSLYGITNRYASALLSQADESNQFEQVTSDIELIHDTIAGSKELKVVLESPVISEEKKLSILNELFSSRVSKESMNFLRLVVEKKREEFLFAITKRVLEHRDEKMNIAPASVTTAFALDESDKEQFQESMENYTGKKIRASYKVDENIIGGFLIKIKDKMLDASILQQLNILKKRLIKSDQTLVN